MSFLSKVELKKQLRDLGIKVEGNYVRKSDIKKCLAELYHWNLDDEGECEDVLKDSKAPVELKEYAKKKLQAMKLRKNGKIQQALKLENELDGMYLKLPEEMRW